MEIKRKCKKKAIFIITVYMVVLCFMPIRIYGSEMAEYQTILEEEFLEDPQAYALGNIDFRLSIHKAFDSYQYITLGFYEVNQHYFVEYTFFDFDESYKFTKTMPEGTYQLAYVEFDEPVINMSYFSDPAVFTVQKDKTTDHVWINVDYMQTVTANVAHHLQINDGHGFQGYLNLTYYDKTDTFFSQKEKEEMDGDPGFVERMQIYHLSVNNPTTVKGVLSAGEVAISQINVYGPDKKPLNVYYKPVFESIDRTMSYNNEIFTDHIYVFRSNDDLDERTLSKIKKEGYILKPSTEMSEYETYPNETFFLYKGQNALFHVYPGDIPVEELEDEDKQEQMVPSAPEIHKVETNSFSSVQGTDRCDEKETHGVGLSLVFIIGSLLFLGCILLMIRKKR